MITRKLLTLLFPVCTLTGASGLHADGPELPEVPREFRAAWIATVSNIDWPSSRNLETDQQKAELVAMLDKAVELNLNAIILQVRPMCDALYASELEPWSEFLTGAMGKAPEPFWDPLKFAVDEAHKRGLELHAWFNPYRARHPSARTDPTEDHVSNKQPEIVREYGDYLWMDPAEEQTKRHTLDVILDVVRRYQVDGVHIDDYFYPYRSYADGAEFPDDEPWQRYRDEGGKLDRDDWRRHHVNDFVERFYREVKQEDPLVKVGISPFGIWRPGHPEGIEGMDQYSALYADAKLWLNEGWVDYFTPQLYWPLEQEAQSYTRLLEWWVEQNYEERHIWPGNYTSRVREQGSWQPQEIIDQIEATREQEGATGNVHFSMIAFMQPRQGLGDQLQEGVYAQPALVPASRWLSDEAPSEPKLKVRRSFLGGGRKISWRADRQDQVRLWVLYRKQSGKWRYEILPAGGRREGSIRLPRNESIDAIAVSAVDFAGNESPVAWRRF